MRSLPVVGWPIALFSHDAQHDIYCDLYGNGSSVFQNSNGTQTYSIEPAR